MQRLLSPRSVVVIGVSERQGNLAKYLVGNIVKHQYQGAIHAVGSRPGEVHGQRIHGSLSEVPQNIDLALIMTPAATVPGVFRECAARGITRAVILTGGFSEYGAEGLELERQLVRIADEYGIRFIGPNCLGLLNTAINLTAFFYPIAPVRRGGISILSQSGNMALVSAFALSREAIGLGKVVSLGNKLNVDEVDLLEYLIEDGDTDAACVYLEDMRRGRDFCEVARKSDKPIVVMKAAVGQLGARAAMSHTAALASDDVVVDAALRQAGVTRVRRFPDLLAAAKALTMPSIQGDNVAVLAASGGVCITAADACEAHGLNLPPFPQDLLDKINQIHPEKVIKHNNPLDFGSMLNADAFMKVVECVAPHPEFHGLMIGPGMAEDDPVAVLKRAKDLSDRTNKPIAVSVGAPMYTRARREVSIPVYDYIEEAVEALALLRDSARYRANKEERAIQLPVDRALAATLLEGPTAAGCHYLGDESLEILSAYGIQVAPARLSASPDEALEVAQALGYPIVMKVRSPDIVHKSDVGGVVTGINSPEEALRTYLKIMASVRERQPRARVEGIVLQRMVAGGREMILGGKRDDSFGPLVMVGLGGIYVEILGDVALRLAPLSAVQAEGMLRELRGRKLLGGVRGGQPADVASLIDSVIRVAQLLVDFPQIVELDVNPLKVLDEGAGSVAVDSRLVIRKG